MGSHSSIHLSVHFPHNDPDNLQLSHLTASIQAEGILRRIARLPISDHSKQQLLADILADLKGK